MSTNTYRSKVLALALAGLLILPNSVRADVGDLDGSFGVGGKVTTDFSGGRDEANALAIQPDGKIVAAGTANGDFALARYNVDGTLDATFGSNGKVITDFGWAEDVASAMAILSNGKIVVA